jgi:hypothetical protein
MQVIQQRRVGGAEGSFALKDLSALDSWDKPRNEGGEASLELSHWPLKGLRKRSGDFTYDQGRLSKAGLPSTKYMEI